MSLDALPNHSPHPFFGVENDCLTLGGRSLLRVAAQAGRTPFYAYVRQHLDDRIRLLRSSLPPQVHLHYAIKANPMPAVVQHIASQVDGLDVASVAEMQVALNAGVAPDRISFAGPGKSEEELARAVAAQIVINVESELEIERLERIAAHWDDKPQIAIRVNPDFELKTSGMKMGGGPKQFGIDAERVPALLMRLAQSRLQFVGFHIFSGSQNLRAEAIVEAQQKSVALAIKLSAHAPSPIKLLNIGGGFGIPYFPSEKPLELAEIATNLQQQVRIVSEQLPQAQLVIELGRYLVGEAGVYVCRVTDRKVSRGQVFLVTDGGLHHHLSASGNFGQIIRKNYPVIIGNRVRGTERETASVVGPLCTPLDLLADRMELARADVGDLVVVLQSGAYGATASPRGFLSHPEVTELLI